MPRMRLLDKFLAVGVAEQSSLDSELVPSDFLAIHAYCSRKVASVALFSRKWTVIDGRMRCVRWYR